jgi:hypothetical protein
MLLSRPVHRFFSLSLFLTFLLSACNPIAASIPPPQAVQSSACPVSQPAATPFTAPIPYPSPPDGYFWYGSDALWTGLPNDGVWQGLPRHDEGYGQKLFIWRVGYDPATEPEPALTISGRRLDGDAPPLAGHVPATHAFGPDIHSAMLTGITFPTAGCWEVTAIYTPSAGDSATLTFVVEIEE